MEFTKALSPMKTGDIKQDQCLHVHEPERMFQYYTDNMLQGTVRSILEYAMPVWDPQQQYLSATYIWSNAAQLDGSCMTSAHTSSATELVSRLNLDPLSLRRTADKATMMYKIMGGLVDAVCLPYITKKDDICVKSLKPIPSDVYTSTLMKVVLKQRR